jgi:hypothetical protein
MEVGCATRPRGRDASSSAELRDELFSRARTRKMMTVMTLGNRLGREPPSSSRLSPLCDLSRPPENSHHLAQYAAKICPCRGRPKERPVA